MSNAGPKRIRTLLPTPKSTWDKIRAALVSPDFRLRLLICAFAALIMWVGTRGWAPPFPYRLGETPQRDLYARTEFSVEDLAATRNAQYEKVRQVLCYYEIRPRALESLEESLINQVFQLKGIASPDELDLSLWRSFTPLRVDEKESEAADRDPKFEFARFREALDKDSDLSHLKDALDLALLDFKRRGLLQNLKHTEDDGPMGEIRVFPVGDPNQSIRVEASEVRIDEVGDELLGKLKSALVPHFGEDAAELLASHLFAWLRPQLPETLTFDAEQTKRFQASAEMLVEPVIRTFRPGDRLELQPTAGVEPQRIVGGSPLDAGDLALLRAEHEAYVRQMSQGQRLIYTLAYLGMFAAMFLLCAAYLYYREPEIYGDTSTLVLLVVMFVTTVLLIYTASRDAWRAELIPLLLFTMIVSTAYKHELALILASAVSLIGAFATGQGMSAFVVMVSTAATASFLCGAIRSRTRLVYVGLIAAAIAIPTALGVNVLLGEPLFLQGNDGESQFNTFLLNHALWYGMSAILGAFLMAALLPFIERTFNIQTDMRLLELGVPSHPLLQSLILRAPGTYNHSINVASLAEAAAKEINANSLLCRVGAYFHDIGKMCKPEYFVENQTAGNKHATLNPQMSTLIIISHVKDGVELAREHKLPQRIIDFIEQHHGTTLVEYFYDLASKQQHDAGETVELNQGNFRYPGPKPQSKEAAVLMLADACESASRTLVDPTPSRIENLVREISKKKLYDGQFDECSLTLRELRRIETSLIKTINAMFHARVKYPEQQTV